MGVQNLGLNTAGAIALKGLGVAPAMPSFEKTRGLSPSFCDLLGECTMNALFVDLEDEDNPMNGKVLATRADVKNMFQRLRGRRPFMFQLQLEDGCKLDVGLAGEVGCIQHSPSDGMPPYRMATTSSNPPIGQGDTDFSVGGTATPIDNRYCLPSQVVERLVQYILDGRGSPDGIAWDDV